MIKEQQQKTETVRTMPAVELSRHGIEHFADLSYRVEVTRRMADSLGVKKAVFFDDTSLAVPENQRHKLHGLPGYERALYPALMAAPSFEDGVTVLAGAPPMAAELRGLEEYKARIDEQTGITSQYRILHERDGQLVDVFAMFQASPESYDAFCKEYAQRCANPSFITAIRHDQHIQTVRAHKDTLTGGERTLVWPFQVTEDHLNQLAPDLQSGEVVMPSTPQIDKAYNNYLLRERGFDALPAMHVVDTYGNNIEDFKTLGMAFENPQEVEKTGESVYGYARGIIRGVKMLEQEGKKAYIKLDSNGVSGLTNIDPEVAPMIYDASVDDETRVKALADVIFAGLDADRLPSFGIVEEFVKMRRIDGIMDDGTTCGLMVDGTFYPTSHNPFQTEHAEYVAQWNAARAQEIGMDPGEWQENFGLFSQIGSILAEEGYRDAILAGDIFRGEDGQPLVHDFNLRRGGRSTPEVMIAVEGGGWFENQSIIDVTEQIPAGTSPEQIHNIYSSVCDRLQEMGIRPFATAFGYFSEKDNHVGLKFKTMTPTGFFDDRSVDRGNHRQYINDVVAELVRDTIHS